MKDVKRFRPGDIVQVCSEREIARTLDDNGMLDGIPFMAEMAKYCGTSFKVTMPVRKVLVEGTGYRVFSDLVLLDGTFCDGKAHEGCGRMCNILWKASWLKKVDSTGLDSTHTGKRSKPEKSTVRYAVTCQSANLKNARAQVPFSVEDFVRNHVYKDSFRKRWPLRKAGSFILFLVLKLKRLFTGGHTIVGSLARTPNDVLVLKKGEKVSVKTRDEILATLDKNGKNRGLGFTPEMLKYCGKTLSVLNPITRIIDEESGEARLISNTVILENVRCDGRYHAKCPRRCYLLWREMWLNRV